MKFYAAGLSLFLSLHVNASCAFLAPADKTSRYTSPFTTTNTDNVSARLSLSSEPNGDSRSGGLSFGSGASLLNDAFANLSQSDQYDAVLTGLCAKILDGEQKLSDADAAAATSAYEGGETDPAVVDPEASERAERTARLAAMTPTQRAFAVLSDPLSLLEEMNGRRVRASPRSLSALIDAAATTESPSAMSSALSLSATNGGIKNFGALQSFVTTVPTNPRTRVVCPDGVRRTKEERLAILQPVPMDDRASEVASALAVVVVLSLCLIVRSFGSLFGLEDLQGPADLVIGSALTVGVVDNFYDAIKGATSLVASTQKDKIPDAVKNANVGLPDKEGMPLGLGQGKITGTVTRGLTRLLSVDTERECQCEAAAFFVAYALGLPCFAFRPNALEGAVLIFESAGTDEYSKAVLDPLLSDAGILKVLIWIMAPVAMESSRHAQLIASDPREGTGLLKRLREKAGTVSAEAANAIEDMLGGEVDVSGDETDSLLRWAYAEADALLRDNRNVVDELTERLAGGAATVGDCVAVLEDW